MSQNRPKQPMNGDFRDIQLDYKEKSNQEQAIAILERVNELHKLGFEKVGITYSANSNQTRDIKSGYERGQWAIKMEGINQAQVMIEIQSLLRKPDYQHLQNVFRIIPITTINKVMGLINAAPTEKMIDKDLKAAKKFIEGGNCLLGWQNQDSIKNKAAPYAIGGGRAGDNFPEKLSKKVQDFLINLKNPKEQISNTQNAQPVASTPSPEEKRRSSATRQTPDPSQLYSSVLQNLELVQKNNSPSYKIDNNGVVTAKDIVEKFASIQGETNIENIGKKLTEVKNDLGRFLGQDNQHYKQISNMIDSLKSKHALIPAHSPVEPVVTRERNISSGLKIGARRESQPTAPTPKQPEISLPPPPPPMKDPLEDGIKHLSNALKSIVTTEHTAHHAFQQITTDSIRNEMMQLLDNIKNPQNRELLFTKLGEILRQDKTMNIAMHNIADTVLDKKEHKTLQRQRDVEGTLGIALNERTNENKEKNADFSEKVQIQKFLHCFVTMRLREEASFKQGKKGITIFMKKLEGNPALKEVEQNRIRGVSQPQSAAPSVLPPLPPSRAPNDENIQEKKSNYRPDGR